MVKVITYGTYDLLHYGHVRLLERAKSLGDYLIVGVTADDFDIARGKINVQQTLMERIDAVRATGIADEIIIEEYVGQKIDDIRKYNVDIFTVGSDWEGTFDYLNEYCKVVYLDRTKGISSSQLRSEASELRIGLVGDNHIVNKFARECKFVQGIKISGVFTQNPNLNADGLEEVPVFEEYERLVEHCDALYIQSHPSKHYFQIKKALEKGKHVLYESPLALSEEESERLFEIAGKNNCVLYEGIKTAYSTAYARMILMCKSGKIGDVVSVDATCTSLQNSTRGDIQKECEWNSITAWGPVALLPVLQLLGSKPISSTIVSKLHPEQKENDIFTKIDFVYPNSVATVKVGTGAKAEGNLVIAGTKGYIYVPAPWWKTDYFEIRYEDQAQNKRFFYQLEGEGIRNMIASFLKSVLRHHIAYVGKDISMQICSIMEDFTNNKIVIG